MYINICLCMNTWFMVHDSWLGWSARTELAIHAALAKRTLSYVYDGVIYVYI